MNNHFIILKYLGAGLLILLFHDVSAQDGLEENEPQPSKHSIHLEIGGRAFIWGSILYEYRIHERVSLGGGLGIINVSQGEITRSNNGVSETGKYLDLNTSQLIYGNYYVGKNKHQLYFTAGLANLLSISRNNYPSEVEWFTEADFFWNGGIGYQFSNNRTIFRFTGYCIGLPEETEFFPKYMPWLGLSFGFRI